MTTLADLEKLAQAHAAAHDALATELRVLEAFLKGARDDALPGIKRLVRKAKEQEAKLEAAIAASPHLFAKPKTHIAHGVRFGLKKEKGKVSFADAGKVIKRIRALLPRLAGDLIKTTETPIKDALAKLPGDTIKKLGVTVGEDTDRPYIKLTDSEVEKLVAAMLKEESAEDEE